MGDRIEMRNPLSVPSAAPATTSLAQCAFTYMRESPTSVAAP
jgi:hypothetical protein